IVKLSYDSLIPVSSDRLIALAENNLKIINLNDSCLGSFPGVRVVKIYKNSLVVGEKHKQGLINPDGKFIYPMIYDSIVCRDDYVLLYARQDSEMGWMMGNREGEILNYGLYESLVPIDRGNILARRKGFWGILNNRGEEKINCIYDTICYNESGLIKVVFHRENGLLWKNRWFIYPGPMQINVMQDDRILVSGYFGSIILNILGDTLYQTEHIIVPEGKFFRVKSREGKLGLLDQDYNTLLYPFGDHITYYTKDSLFVFKSVDGWGAVNSSGKTLFYNLTDIDSILSFSDGYFRVLIDRNYGFIDVNGKLRIANRYAEAMDFNDGIAPVKILGRWGFISKNEKFLIQPFYDDVFSRYNGFIVIRRGAGTGIINNQGESVQDEEYQAVILQPSGGFLCTKNGLYGYINTRGSLTVIPRYDDIQVLNNGSLIVSRNNKFGLLSGSGETILPVIYDGLFEDPVLQCMIGLIRSGWRDL
ncbi:MAG TPA: WG repeat-containing protein, partial [Cyclobacteriaceae bacterium]|nr:WG repeat-containing protein [Cyclobacteriaceae bacterium]